MSRSLLNSPLVLGFEHFAQMLERLAKHPQEGYPPYNIEQWGQEGFRITLAVAGFDRCHLHVALEGHQLVIRGKKDEDPEHIYLYRGIATRQFQRVFVLAEGIKVVRAHMSQGLLHIDLHQPLASRCVEEIPIENSSTTKTNPRIEGPVRRALAVQNGDES